MPYVNGILAALAAIPAEAWAVIVPAVLGLFGVRRSAQKRAARAAAEIATALHPKDNGAAARALAKHLTGEEPLTHPDAQHPHLVVRPGRKLAAKLAARALRAAPPPLPKPGETMPDALPQVVPTDPGARREP